MYFNVNLKLLTKLIDSAFVGFKEILFEEHGLVLFVLEF